jgi:pimeloyl-ACP methyl ester carboxylesterase
MAATPKSKAASRAELKARRQTARTAPPGWKDPLAQQQPLVSGTWLIRALLAVIGCAFVFAYLTLCLLFYQGQWQIVFHPSRTVATTPASIGIKYDDIRFDYTGTGVSQLDGWWIPAEPNSPHAPPNSGLTLLFLRDGRGSLSDDVQQLKTLHSLGVSVFAFDYRGFGNSANDHPSEQRVYEDADAAWAYLTDIRHLDPKSIVLYGAGLGATIAAETAVRHRDSSALILENPAPPALSLIEADSRTHLIPIRWLFRDRFEIEPKLHQLGAELRDPMRELVKSGKTPHGPVIVRQETAPEKGPRLLIFFGSNPISDPRYVSTLSEFLEVSSLKVIRRLALQQ